MMSGANRVILSTSLIQAWEFLEGKCDEAGLGETGIAATRQLAKRLAEIITERAQRR